MNAVEREKEGKGARGLQLLRAGSVYVCVRGVGWGILYGAFQGDLTDKVSFEQKLGM